MKKIFLIIFAILFIAIITNTGATAALTDNGDGTVTDSAANLMWLQNANYFGATMTWNNAIVWADNFVFAGYDDWRLPASDNCLGNDCANSEMGRLFYVEEITSLTPKLFVDVKPFMYWSGTEYDPSQAWRFSFKYGTQDTSDKNLTRYAWAVRNAALPPVVPEPSSLILFFSGGAMLFAKIFKKTR